MKVDSCVRPTPERTTIWLPSYGRHTACQKPRRMCQYLITTEGK